MTYKGKASHKTLLGGLATIFIYSSLLFYVGWRFIIFQSREKDKYWTSLTVSDWKGVGSF